LQLINNFFCILYRLTVFRFSVPTFGTNPKRQGIDPTLGVKNSGFGSKNNQSSFIIYIKNLFIFIKQK